MTNFLELLYRALSSPYGIAVRVSNTLKAKQAFYRVRRDSADPSLSTLSIRSSPTAPNEELWIVRQEKND